MVKAVIFDLDGTLVDSFSAYLKVFNLGITAFGREPVAGEFLQSCLARVSGLREILLEVFPLGTEEGVIEGCMGEIRRLFLEVEAREVRPFPGVEELFAWLFAKGVKIGIATGRMSAVDLEWKRFVRFGLDGYIAAVVTSKEVERRKPAPDVIVQCAARMGVGTDQCIAVGDTVADMAAAKAGGAYAVAIAADPEERKRLLEAGADAVCATISELALLLEGEISS